MARCHKRLAPGGPVTVTTMGTFTPSVIKGRVARCEVGGIGQDGAIHYKIGIVFDETVSLPEEDPELRLVESAPEPEVENRW